MSALERSQNDDREAFLAADDFVAGWEGGLVDDPHDRGGITKWGMSLRALAAKGLDLNNDGAVNRRDILEMTQAQKREIFYRDYWRAAKCHLLPAPLALIHYDCAINQGTGRAPRILQASAGAKVDGAIGPKTLAAVERAWARDPAGLLVEYAARRAVHYSSLAQIARYGLGWFRRLFDAHRAALHELREG